MAEALSQPAPAQVAPGLARQITLLAAVVIIALGSTVGLAVVTATRPDPPSSSRAAADRPCPTPAPAERSSRFPDLRLATHRIGMADEPSALALEPGGNGHGVLAERAGRLLRVDDGVITHQVVLDLRADTAHVGDGGLLGAAYAPDGRWLYVYRTTQGSHDVITAYPIHEGRQQLSPAEERVILRVARTPSKQHHGGSFVFGADGMLYVGLGDGGGLGDPRDNAQDPSTLLGKVLRIDPTPDGLRPYRIPADNPFIDRFGWAPEIWLLGVRNPFRMSVDAATGDLWLGDVGQSCWEELNRLATGSGGVGGSNLGWDRREGAEPFEGGTVLGDELRPVHTYSHHGGRCAVVAGYVVRGPTIPELEGWLLFTDFCAGRLLAVQSTAESDRSSDEGRQAHPTLADVGIKIDSPVAIVAGPGGRPWVLSLEGPIYELVSR